MCLNRRNWKTRQFKDININNNNYSKSVILYIFLKALAHTHYLAVVGVQSLSMSDSLQSHGLQHTRLPSLSLSPRVLLKLMSIESVMSFNHLILCLPLLLLPSIFPGIRVFSNRGISSHQVAKILELQLRHQSLHIQQWFPLGSTGLILLLSKGLSRLFSNTRVQKHQFFGTQLSL